MVGDPQMDPRGYKAMPLQRRAETALKGEGNDRMEEGMTTTNLSNLAVGWSNPKYSH